KARFARFDRRENLLCLVTMPALTLLAYVALTSAARLRYELLQPAEYTFVADYSDWLLPACLIGILLTALALEVRRNLVLKSQAAERDALDLRLISANPTRARQLTWVSSVFMLVIIPLFVIASLNNYALFRTDTIVIRPFGSLHEVQHQYEDISSVSWVELVQGRSNDSPARVGFVQRRVVMVWFERPAPGQRPRRAACQVSGRANRHRGPANPRRRSLVGQSYAVRR